MSIDKNKIVSIAEEIINDQGCFFIDHMFRGDKRQQIIEFFIDSADVVSAETCAKVSREISHRLDEEELIDSKYRLDVSSPGTDRPLKFIEQFNKHVGRKFELEYEAEGELIKAVGQLIKVDNDDLLFKIKKDEIKLKFENIKSAKVKISF